MRYVHTLQTSILPAQQNSIAQWIDDFLNGEGGNAALASGLKRERREYFGPISLSIEAVGRCCGPEAGMRYPVSQEDFDRRVEGIKKAIATGLSLPPLIINFSDDKLTLSDGNHRYQALKELGFNTIDTIVWTTGAQDMKKFMAEYENRFQRIF